MRSDFIVAALAITTLLATGPSSTGAQTEPAIAASARRHFILLLDDSGDSPLRPSPWRDPAAVVASALYANIGGEPGFDHTRDRLSVVFFQVIGSRPNGCFADRPLLSPSPEGMFELVRPPIEALITRELLAGYLRSELAMTEENGGCRFARGGYSPIERSKRLVLPYLTRHDPEAHSVSKIYLIQVSNRRSNPLGDVPEHPGSRQQFADQHTSADLQNRVDEAVSFSPLGSQDPVAGLFVDRFRVTPKAAGVPLSENILDVPRSVELRRRAVSAGRIRLEPVNGSIRLRRSDRLVPVWLKLWTQTTPPRSKTIDVEKCERPCEIAGQERVVDVAGAILPATEIPADAVLEPMDVLAASRFRYVMPEIYDNFVVDSTVQPIRLHPEPFMVVPPSSWVRRPLPIDNRVLAGAWEASDRNGLDQATAARRIAARRATTAALIVLSASILILIAVYLLVTHRGFQPELDLNPSSDDAIDFNTSIPELVERMQVHVFNSATAIVERFQRSPAGAWTLVLNGDVSAIWPESGGANAKGIDLSRLVCLRDPADGNRIARLSGRGDSSAVLALDRRSLAALEPPPDWSGGEVTLRVTGSLQLQSERGTEQVPYSHDVPLLPEHTAPPQFLAHIPDAVQWTAGQALDLGTVILASGARHRFAVAADVRHRFALHNDDGLLHNEERRVRVHGKETVSIPLIVPEGVTPNPTHLEEAWSVQLSLENQQPVERKVLVRKDVSAPEAHLSIVCGTEGAPIELAWHADQLHARQGSRSLSVADDDVVEIAESGRQVYVGRNDASLVLCAIRCSLGKPALGGQFQVVMDTGITIGEEETVPVYVQVRNDDGDATEATEIIVTAAKSGHAIVSMIHADAFNSLAAQGRVAHSSVLRLELTVTFAENGRTARHHATLLIRQQLVRHEVGTILAVDFGNSAIAVATLAPGAGEAYVARLQEIPLLATRTLADEDPENAESGSCLIPSAFSIEFDRRGSANGGRPGTHWGPVPDVLDGSDPRTISLPALSAHYSAYPERVVQSIKHVMASDYDEMELYEPIRFRPWSVKSFKVDKLLTGVMKALAETYTGADTFERLVFTVPNTFLPWQEKRIRAAIEAAFTSARQEWTRGLSESDAVMHWYLDKLPKNPRKELILFYDFGSGTIDLTLADVSIDENGTSARIVARIGLDRAGSYLDQVLTSIVHRRIAQVLPTAPDAYRYPLLGGSANAGVTNFASELAAAKKHWSVGEPLRISQHNELTSIVDPSAWSKVTAAGLTDVMQRLGVNVNCISLGWDAIHDDPRISRFFQFIENDLVAECLHSAAKSRRDVTRVVVSGRGALWPGFMDELEAAFAQGVSVERISNVDDDMKLAVVRGAASWLQKREMMNIESSTPDPTYLAITDLDVKTGGWRHIRRLGPDPIPLPAGGLKLAVIDFPFDERTLAAMLRHPIGRRLVRILPFDLPVGHGREVQAFLAREQGRTRIRIDDGVLTDVVSGGRKWPVGNWSAWNSSQLGDEE